MDFEHYPRTDLAQRYLDRLTALPERALSIFGPRQVGKTTLLQNDLSALAHQRGLTPVYVDFMSADDPLHALSGRLEDLLLDVAGQLRNTQVTRVSAAGFGVTLAPAPVAARSPDPGVQLQHHMAALKRVNPDARLLLMLDEAQELVRKRDGERAMKAIRGLFNTYRRDILLLMTGSSRDGLLRLFGEHHRASFGLADHEDFQVLGREFVEFVVRPLNQRLNRPLDIEVLSQVFAQLHHRPADFVAFVSRAVMTHVEDLLGAVKPFLASRYPVEAIRERFFRFTPLQQVLLAMIASGTAQLTGAAALREVASRLGTSVSAAAVSKALASLPVDTLVTHGRGRHEIADPGLLHWLRERATGDGVAGGG